MSRPFKWRIGYLSIIVAIAAWQAYRAFDRIFALTGQEMINGGNSLWYWFFAGPISLFLASALGLLFALLAAMTKHPAGKPLWNISLWVLTTWLAAGAFVFLSLDWFAHGVHSPPLEHAWNLFGIALPMLLAAALLGNVAYIARNAPEVLPAETHPKWKSLFSTGTRVIGWLSLAAGSVLVVVASALALLLFSCTPPSLRSLARRFPSERTDLETIIRMSDQDSELAVIDPGWLQPRNGPEFSTIDTKAGITEARWDEYRRIFRRNDITQGIRRYQAGGDAFIIVKSEGILDNGYSNGFLYCGPGPEHFYPPCSSQLEHGDHPYSHGDEAYSFIKLSDRWYAFSQGPG